MKISKLRIAAIFSIVMAILLNILQEYTKERAWFYIQIGVMLLAVVLMTVEGKKNGSTISPKITKVFIILGIIMLLVLIGIMVFLLSIK